MHSSITNSDLELRIERKNINQVVQINFISWLKAINKNDMNRRKIHQFYL